MQTKLKTILLTGFALALLSAGSARAADYGVWERPSTGSHVHFYDCGGKLCGKVIAVKDEARKGEIGKMILRDAIKSGGNSWKGDLIDAGTGKVYTGTVTLQGATLDLQGCIMSMLCQSESWRKVK